MSKLYEWLNNPQFMSGVITFSSVIFGFLLALIIEYYKKRRGGIRRSTWTLNVVNDLGSSLPDLEQGPLDQNLKVLFNGQQCKRLSITRVILWNGSNETLERKHIAQAHPITITAKEPTQILDIYLKDVSNSGNGIQVNKIDSHTYIINFDYLEKKEGCVLDVYHTGYTQEAITVTGSIKGFKKIGGNYLSDYSYISRRAFNLVKRPRHLRFIMTCGITFSIIMLISAFSEFGLFNYEKYREYMRVQASESEIPFFYFMAILLSGSIISYGLTLLWLSLTRRAPKDLSEFEADWLTLMYLDNATRSSNRRRLGNRNKRKRDVRKS